MKDKLLYIQQNLKAPKGQMNKFGGYKYRSCEDIFEAVKPLLKEKELILQTTDELVQVGDRYYIKATAMLSDGKETISNTAYAREEETKKGMDGSQITGASSSYARKYALNGLFLIDDVKDSDSTNTGSKDDRPEQDLELVAKFQKLLTQTNTEREKLYKHYKVKNDTYLTNEQLKDAISKLEDKVLLQQAEYDAVFMDDVVD